MIDKKNRGHEIRPTDPGDCREEAWWDGLRKHRERMGGTGCRVGWGVGWGGAESSRPGLSHASSGALQTLTKCLPLTLGRRKPQHHRVFLKPRPATKNLCQCTMHQHSKVRPIMGRCWPRRPRHPLASRGACKRQGRQALRRAPCRAVPLCGAGLGGLPGSAWLRRCGAAATGALGGICLEFAASVC